MSQRSALATTDWHCIDVHTSADVRVCIGQILAAMQGAGFDGQETFGTRLALEEAVVNAIRHGNRGDPSKRVEVRLHVTSQQTLVEVEDQGRGFDPDAVPDPRSPDHLERAGGRGVFLIRHYMTWVQYNETGTCVTLCKMKTR